MNRRSKPIAFAVFVVPLFSPVSDAQALPREQAEIVFAAADAAIWADVTIAVLAVTAKLALK